MALPNTHIGPEKIGQLLSGRKKIFFDGIGGISMNSLAHITKLMGHTVCGYDRTKSEITAKLEAMGITVYYTADEANAADCDALVYTVAMPNDNPEYVYAGEHHIPRISRADYLGYIMTGFERRIGVSGTHGKSTTTGMLAKILLAADVSPTVFNGAPMKETGTVDIIGGREFFAFEACEYMDSFLDFNPTTAVVLNIELDHVDYFKSIGQIVESFRAFIGITGRNGIAVLNNCDENCRLLYRDYPGQLVTFGRNDPDADYYSANERERDGYPEFDIMKRGSDAIEAHITLRISGSHNISDALAAYAAAVSNGISPESATRGLCEYNGICRRMERLAELKSGAALYSDYAHHPTEIAATLNGAKHICRGKLNVVFQPHTFSRTADLFDGFVSAFADSPADEIVLCDIYPARETNIYGVTSDMLAEQISERGKKCSVRHTFEEAAEYLDSISDDGDIALVMGAGDVIRVAELLRDSSAR